MDHLDRPTNPSRDQFKIAYLCLAPYDGGDFLTFPSRRGFDNADVLEGDFSRKSPEGSAEPVGLIRVQSFLQSWLFFGLLCEVHKVIGTPFNQRDYISQDSLLIGSNGRQRGSIRTINTRALPGLLSLWENSFKQKRSTGEMSFEDVRRQCIKIDTYLQSAYKVCLCLVRSHHSYVDEDLLLSFMCMGCAIDDAMAVIYHRCFYDFLPTRRQSNQVVTPPGWVPMRRKWEGPRTLYQRLLYFGWCPFDLGILRRDFGINEIIYASQIRRHGDVQRHLACTSTECIANNVNRKTYKTRHGTLGKPCNESGCHDVDLDYISICEILRSGLIPIIKSETNAFGEIEFSIVPYLADEFNYVAISHVWSHGAGNTMKNTLPKCQLEALHSRTAPLLAAFGEYGGPAISAKIRARMLSFFWIDTICVPVRPDNADLRNMAISRMAQTYEQAHSVLVLDEGLMHTSLRTDDKTIKSVVHIGRRPPPPVKQKELVMSVMFSDWWRRLWTLQEGVLPDQLFVAFADGSMHISHVVPAGAEEHVQNRADLSTDRVKGGLTDLIDKAHLVDGGGTVTVDRTVAKENSEYRRRVLKLLCNRTTSRASDEPICIATLMGLDPQILLDTDIKDRMQMLYACLGTIPAGLVFLPVPKLQAEHFRWAPRSLIGTPINLSITQVLLSEEDSDAEVTESGVRLQAAGYPLASLGTPLNDNFYIFPGPPGSIPYEEEEARLTERDNVISSNEHIIAIRHYDQTVEDTLGDSITPEVTPWTALNPQDLVDPVVILPHLRKIEHSQNVGILATKARLIDGVWHARFQCSVWCNSNWFLMWGDSSVSRATVKNRLDSERAALAQGTRTGNMAWFQGSEVHREWCIS